MRMVTVCSFCGKSFTSFDNHKREYCSDCRHSGKRYAQQFKERRKNDPVTDIHAKYYSKHYNLYKANKLSKSVLDDWRYKAKIKKHQISTGKITVEDFAKWCAQTYDQLKTEVGGYHKPADKMAVVKGSGYERTMPLTTNPHLFIGRKPTAVLFGDERMDVKSWRDVFVAVLSRCNQDVRHNETLMYLRNKIAGQQRVFLSDSPVGMTRPVKIDEDMYAESHYGAETLMHILVVRILSPVGFDCSNVRIVIK